MAIGVTCSNIIKKEDKFLLVQETKEHIKGLFNLPSGGLDGNESVVECAKREAFEETGLRVKVKRLVGVYQRKENKKKDNVVVLIFESKVIGGKLTLSEEHPEVKYFSLEDIRLLNKNKKLRNEYVLSSIESFIANNKVFDFSHVV